MVTNNGHGYWQNQPNYPEDHPENPHPGKYHYKYDCQNCSTEPNKRIIEDEPHEDGMFHTKMQFVGEFGKVARSEH